MNHLMERRTEEAIEWTLLRTTTTTTTTTTTKNMKYLKIVNNKQSKSNEDKRWWNCQRNLVKICMILMATTLLEVTPRVTAFAAAATTVHAEQNIETTATKTTRNHQQAPSSAFRPSPSFSTATSRASADDASDFRPLIPSEHQLLENISIKETDRPRVFQPLESESPAATSTAVPKRFPWQQQTLQQHQQQLYASQWKLQKEVKSNALPNNKDNESATQNKKQKVTTATATATASTTTSPSSTMIFGESPANETLDIDLKSLEDLLLEYVENYFTKGQYEPLPGLVNELQKNRSAAMADEVDSATFGRAASSSRSVRHVVEEATSSSPTSLLPSSSVSPQNEDRTMSSDSSAFPAEDRSIQSGRLLFITGLKKVLWPIFVGLQILKSLLFAMFLPSLIGSFGKLVSKGITSASIRPLDPPQDLDFRDNTFNFDEENNKFIIHDDGGKDDGSVYPYHQPAEAASQTHYDTYNSASLNGQALSRYGVNEKQLQRMPDSYMSALQSIGAASFKNSGSLSSGSSMSQGGAAAPSMGRKPMAAANANNFQMFQKVPVSSLLLSNYDPFYSPLLSRLDSVFAQLKLNSEKEICREKLICLMYSNPAKYAPYSNLVSAQLSRELNELRKPTSDNPDILRFFKYMRAAKDGQDGIDCETSFDGCKEFKDFENPAMVATFHDINKLVQARKLGA